MSNFAIFQTGGKQYRVQNGDIVKVEQKRADKILVFKKKRRQNYRRTAGHRQYVTVLKITEIKG